MAFLPRDIAHAYRIDSATACVFAGVVPAGTVEFFREIDWDLSAPLPKDWAVSMRAVAAAMAMAGNWIVGLSHILEGQMMTRARFKMSISAGTSRTHGERRDHLRVRVETWSSGQIMTANKWRESLACVRPKELTMPQYVVLADHAPDTCPSSNAKVRARAREGLGQLLPKLAKDAGVTFTVEPLHLNPGHRSIAVVEAPNIEAVIKLVFDTGMSQWNTVEVCPVTPTAEMMADVDDFPIIFD